MKIKYDNLYENIIYIILFILSINITIKSVVVVAFLTALTMILYVSDTTRYHNKQKWLSLYVWGIYLLFILEFIRNNYINTTKVDNSFIIYIYSEVLLVILAYPIFNLLCVKRKKFLLNIVKIGYLSLIIRTFFWILNNFFHMSSLFYKLGFGRAGWGRKIGSLLLERASGTYLDGLLFCCTLILLFEARKLNNKIKAGLGIIFLLFFTTVVYQSRFQLIIYILLIITCLLYFSFKTKKNKIITIFLLFLFLATLVMFFKDKIQNFLLSFSIYSENSSSTVTRIAEYSYFKDLWHSTSIWWGAGFISDANNGILYQYGPFTLRLFVSDVGILMQLYEFGIIGFILSLIPLIKGIVQIIECWTFPLDSYNGFIILISTYLIISSFSFNPYTYALAPFLPIYVGILMNFGNKKNNNN